MTPLLLPHLLPASTCIAICWRAAESALIVHTPLACVAAVCNHCPPPLLPCCRPAAPSSKTGLVLPPPPHTHTHTQVSTLDFTKAPESSLTTATLLGSCIKAAAPLLMGAPPDSSTAAAAGGSSSSSMPLPQELLETKVRGHVWLCQCTYLDCSMHLL
jgi:hypothetical protein